MSRIVGVEVERYRVAGAEGADGRDYFRVVIATGRFESYRDALAAGDALARIVAAAELEDE